MTTSTKRHEKMAAMFKDGQTLEEIGRQFLITRERVRQLLKEIGITGKDGGKTVSLARARAIRDATVIQKYGCTMPQWRTIPRDARRAHTYQKKRCPSRSVEWKMTVWEWWSIWRDSGMWGQRGRHRGQYVMARKGDCGPYSKENVYITTTGNNIRLYYEKKFGGDRGAMEGAYFPCQ